MALTTLRVRIGPERGNRFDFDQQFRTAEDRLNTRRSRQRIDELSIVESRALFIEGGIVALDVA